MRGSTRTASVKEQGEACYHVVSRVVDRQRVLTRDEKERFRKYMRNLEAFTGVEVLTYALLDNHFHLLLHVPDRVPVSDADLVRRIGFIYSDDFAQGVGARISDLRTAGTDQAAEDIKTTYTYRMYDLSQFMKAFKQHLTQSYNKRHSRQGTLWESRYKSLLVEGRQGSLSAVGAYIDLNAVRAKIVKDPKDYRFCGYAEAVAGSAQARKGISRIACTLNQADVDWQTAANSYRQLLYVTGEDKGPNEAGKAAKPGFSEEQVRAVLEAGGTLPFNTVLRCRVRYFTNGAVLGCRQYVDEVIQRHRLYFGAKRKTGACPMKNGHELFVARRLRLNIISLPAASAAG